MIEEVISVTGLKRKTILGRNRSRDIAITRQLCWKLLHEKYHLSYQRIAISFDERNHSTILQGISHANDLLTTGDEFTWEMWNKIRSV